MYACQVFDSEKMDIENAVHCVTLMAQTEDDRDHLLQAFSIGAKFDNIYVNVMYIGTPTTSPRGSGSN